MVFVVEYSLLSDLCSSSRLLSKEAHLGLVCKGGVLRVFAYDYKAILEFSINITAPDFAVGIGLEKFISVSKRLSPGKITFDIKSKKLKIMQSNMSASFPILADIQEPISTQDGMVSVIGDKVGWLMGALLRCDAAVAVPDKFDGVLIDQTELFTRVGKFSGVAIAISTCAGTILPYLNRYVVSSNVISTLKSFKTRIQTITLNNNWIYFTFENNFILKACLLNDSLPSDYIESLGLLEGVQLVDKGKYTEYIFDRDEFYSAIDTVMVLADNKRSPVGVKSIGFEKETGLLVWEVCCKSHDGSLVKESFKCSELVDSPSARSFKVSGLDLVNALSIGEDSVYLYDSDIESVTIISDSGEYNITMLVKSVGNV